MVLQLQNRCSRARSWRCVFASHGCNPSESISTPSLNLLVVASLGISNNVRLLHCAAMRELRRSVAVCESMMRAVSILYLHGLLRKKNVYTNVGVCVVPRLRYRTRQKRSGCSCLCKQLRISAVCFVMTSPRHGFGVSKVRFSASHTFHSHAYIYIYIMCFSRACQYVVG